MSYYDADFYAENQRVALAAANAMLPWVLSRTHATSVIDVGCGSAAWASIAKKLGCGVFGVDGHTPESHLLIDPEEFEQSDLRHGVDCSGYDLAICLEVGEHLPETSAPALIAGLSKAKYVLWSAAVPGQHGVNHITERWQSWWDRIFLANNYCGSDDIRRVFWDTPEIAPFYKQNMAVYSQPIDLLHAGMLPGVRDQVHPDNPHIAPPCLA